MTPKKQEWQWSITPRTSWLGAPWKELVAHKDLLFGLFRKEILSAYQQTLLGPFWIVLQPLLSVLIYVLVFSRIMGVSTQGVPPFLFYLSGVTLWNLFSELLSNSSNSISANAYVFGKVYFPRIIAPLATVLVTGFRFGIHFIILAVVTGIYLFQGNLSLEPMQLSWLPVPILLTAGMAFGAGLLFSVITTKYRDLAGVLQLVLRLLMFVSPVFYSIRSVPPAYQWMVNLNPLTPVFELFRLVTTGEGSADLSGLLYATAGAVVLVGAGILLFNKKTDKLVELA